MTSSKTNDIMLLALGGLFIGSLLGLLAAGAYATWVQGGNMSNIGFGTIFAFLPVSWQYIAEPFRTSAMIGGGVALAGAVLLPMVAMPRILTSHGSARWATEAEMKRAKLLSDVKKLNGPIFGKTTTPEKRGLYLTSTRIPHSLVTAPTGVGKGVGIVTGTLLTYPGSIVCLDLKGANYENTARHRQAMGDSVYKFAPYDPDGRTHRFNPLDAIVETPERRRFTEARRLAASFLALDGDTAQGFLKGARDIFAATALLMIQRGTPSIAAVHDALSGAKKDKTALSLLAAEVRSARARAVFHKYANRDDKHLSAYMSILMDAGLGLWNDPMVRDATAVSDFKLGTLRSKPASLFLVIPPNDIEPLAPLVRLVFQQAVTILQRSLPDKKKGEKYPVLMLLDEFVSLGRMDNLKSAITTLREYDVRVMLVVQTISSLRDLYGKDGAGTFISNCGVQLFMGPADEETPDYISKAIGDYTRTSRSKSWKGGTLTTSYSERMESARLIRPEQVRLLGETQVVALVQNQLPILAHRVTYYEDRELNRIFESQKGPFPDTPEIEPYDPEEPDPDDGTPPKGFNGDFLDDRDDVDEVDDETDEQTLEGEEIELDADGENAPAMALSNIDEPASSVTPYSAATADTPELDEENDSHRKQLIEAMERLSLDADNLTERLQMARRKNTAERNKQAKETPPENDAENETSSHDEAPKIESGQVSNSASDDVPPRHLGKANDTRSRLHTARAQNKKRLADQTV